METHSYRELGELGAGTISWTGTHRHCVIIQEDVGPDDVRQNAVHILHGNRIHGNSMISEDRTPMNNANTGAIVVSVPWNE